MSDTTELLLGTLNLLILKAVSLGPLHGYGVLLRIGRSPVTLQVPQGSLYPALYRLEHQGLIASEWGERDNKRKAKSTGIPRPAGDVSRKRPRPGCGSPRPSDSRSMRCRRTYEPHRAREVVASSRQPPR